MHWHYIKLSELAEFKNGLNYSKDNWGEGLKVIGVADFKNRMYPEYENLQQINPNGVVRKSDYLEEGDILFVRSNGNRELIGRSLLIKGLEEKISHSGFTIRARFFAKDIFIPFYFYVFKSDLIRSVLSLYGGGTNINNLNQGILSRLIVPKIPIDVQKKIAAILSSYDDLIENNQRRIALLEKMAEEIYREWFVRFRFPGYQTAEFEKGIPKGWEKTPINKKLDFKSGFAFKSEKYVVNGKYGVVTIKNVHDGKFISECSDFIDELPDRLPKHCYIKDGDILMSLTGNVGRVCMAQGENLLLNQRVVILKAKNTNHSNFIYWSFRQKSMLTFCEMIATGAAQQNLSPIKLGDQEIIYPSDNLLLEFQEKINPITQMTLSLTKQIAQLEKTRNLLLPRLISGKLSVENLDIQFPPSMSEDGAA